MVRCERCGKLLDYYGGDKCVRVYVKYENLFFCERCSRLKAIEEQRIAAARRKFWAWLFGWL